MSDGLCGAIIAAVVFGICVIWGVSKEMVQIKRKGKNLMKWEVLIRNRLFCCMGFWGHHGYCLDFTTGKHNWRSKELKLPKVIHP